MKQTFRLRLKRLLLASLLILGLAFSLITGQVFNEQAIKNQLQQFAAAHRCIIDFAPDIDRQWFPYPAVILRQVKLKLQNHHTPDFQSDSVRIELGWSNLWGKQIIRNITVHNAQIRLQENPENGQWQLANLPLENQTNNWTINHIRWNDSHIQLHQAQQQLQLHHSNGHFDWTNGQFDFTAQTDQFGLGKLAAQGQYQNNQFTPLNGQAALTLPDGQSIRLDWQSQARYQQRQLTGQSAKLNIQIPHLKLDLEATPKDWHISTDETYIAEMPFVFTAQYGQFKHNGSGLVHRLHHHNGHWQLPAISADTAITHGRHETTLNLNGSFTRQANGHFQFEPLIIQNRLQVAGGTSPTLLGQWQGYLKGNGRQTWQAQLSGTLDTHPAQLTFNSQEHEGQTHISADFQTHRLNLAPYFRQGGLQQGLSESAVQTWRQLIGQRQLTLGLNINTLDAWGVQIKQLQTRIQANLDGAQTEQLQMALYNGQATGQVGLHNRPHNGWFARLDFTNVHIKPLLQDLFRFNHLTGEGNAQIHLAAQGLTPQQWRQSLNGHSEIRLDSGAWQGINLSHIIHNPQPSQQNQFSYNDNSQTRFNHFYAMSHFSEGHGYTTELTLSNPQLQLRGQGDFDIRNGTLHYALLLNRGRNAWLPLKISGNIQRPTFALDYSRMTHGLDSPQAKQQALQDILNQQWSWIQKRTDTPASTP